ncbi:MULTISPECIES: hypothetical protein [Paraburkholderia]|uniref:Uncharacterized protein n=1 Tax=Paraburkholderia megapolitana TaxID=420953 RepID=A0A1I3H1R6_9BURK|nr:MULTISPECIES: hypothetical protein [Paraburkholderia]MCX4159953.1 hypothetical protein [Paraburkholderia megapolitana]MDN7155453.1 hypothetical protein [Paraburkholderia sp. CHISQ3]MDQ6492497.1 hypothetical protein [Paraburkholderia megapolitana]QDQ83150.1 hypothetical protein FNZ07_18225 [Paraburkholderia megapolitana]SFI29512.1 hypothetical protein SAMN05192543_102798 [Paraburkholderia megapolitana]
MGKFVGSQAVNIAVDIVRDALRSDAIKLLGPINKDEAEACAKADAKYLATLLNEVHEQITNPRPQG